MSQKLALLVGFLQEARAPIAPFLVKSALAALHTKFLVQKKKPGFTSLANQINCDVNKSNVKRVFLSDFFYFGICLECWHLIAFPFKQIGFLFTY